jgi:hypothetical protein
LTRSKLTSSEREGVEIDQNVHLDLGIEILKAILTETSSTSPLPTNSFASYEPRRRRLEEVRKALISFLGKLTLPEAEEAEEWKVRSAQTLLLAIPTVYFHHPEIRGTGLTGSETSSGGCELS